MMDRKSQTALSRQMQRGISALERQQQVAEFAPAREMKALCVVVNKQTLASN